MNNTDTNTKRSGTLAKLPYILLGVLDNEIPESVDYIIAKYILDHIHKLSGDSIQEIADACEVSKSTLSRFCRKIGLEDFQEMKDELADAHPARDRFFHVDGMDGKDNSYLKLVSEQVLKLDEALDYQKIKRLVKEMYETKNVLFLGSMQAMNPAMNLQQDLFSCAKVTRVPSLLSLQTAAIDRCKPNDLILCFSNSGTYFDRILITKKDLQKLSTLRVWMITGNPNAHKLPYVDEIIYIPDNHNYVSHPLQFDLTVRVIAMAYADYSRKVESE